MVAVRIFSACIAVCPQVNLNSDEINKTCRHVDRLSCEQDRSVVQLRVNGSSVSARHPDASPSVLFNYSHAPTVALNSLAATCLSDALNMQWRVTRTSRHRHSASLSLSRRFNLIARSCDTLAELGRCRRRMNGSLHRQSSTRSISWTLAMERQHINGHKIKVNWLFSSF